MHHVLAVALGIGLVQVGAKVVEDAVEAGAGGLALGRAVEQEVLVGAGDLAEGNLQVDLVLVCGELDKSEEVLGAGAGAHGSVEQGLGPVGDGLGGVEVVDASQAVALGAGAIGGVEREAAGLEAGDVDAALGAGHGGGVEGLFLLAGDGILHSDEDEAVRHLKGFTDGGFKATGVVFGSRGGSVPDLRVEIRGTQTRGWLQDDAVDDGFDGMVFALLEAHAFGEFDHLAVDAGTEALLIEGFELLAELALAAADDGGEDGDALPRGLGGDALYDLVGCLAGDGAVAVGAVRLAYGGVEKAEVVVDLGNGADGGAGRSGRGLLLYGDGW